MKRLISVTSLLVLSLVGTVGAQLAAPNAMGVSLGHIHYHVRDVEAYKKFWMALGAQPTKLGTTDVMKLQDVLIFLSQGEASAGASIISHVAFRVPSLAKLDAQALKLEIYKDLPGVGFAFSPDGDRVELFDNMAPNAYFTLENGKPDPSLRYSNKINVPILPHHIHLYVPEGAQAEARSWYLKMFGGTPGKRYNYTAVDLPGINLNFSGSKTPLATTKGRRLDHIGFEVKNLEAFCKKLEASGVKLDSPYTKRPTGIATAFLTDPWGTYIELTEGLNRL